MLDKTQIRKTLRRVTKLYSTNQANYQATFFAKLAIIEVSGWIEEAIDDIILSCATQNLKKDEDLSSLRKRVEDNSSFKYEPNFKELLEQLLGLICVERLEAVYDDKNNTKIRDHLSKMFGFPVPQDFNGVCSFDNNLRRNLIHLFGKLGVDSLERSLSKKKFEKMTPSLARLKDSRDKQAHTYLKPTTPSLESPVDAPNLIKSLFDNSCPGLENIEASLNKLTST